VARARIRSVRLDTHARRRPAALVVAILFVVASVIVIGRLERSPTRLRAASSTRDSRRRPPPPSTVSPTARSTRATSPLTALTPVSSGPPWSVRQATLELVDPTRSSPARGTSSAHSGRVLRTTVRWPVSQNGQVASGRLPLIVFAHGYDVSAGTYALMLDDLTRAGLIVAAPDFPGESTAYPGPAVESDLVNEPCDMEFVAASLQRHPPAALRRALPHAPLIVAGHSDGATAAAWAGYASTCSTVPIRAVVALSPDDVPMTGAFRFGRPAPLLAVTGTADEINPLAHTLALYGHVPTPAWLVTVDGGSHLGTFTTDPELARVDAMIADFALMVADHNPGARRRFEQSAGGRIHLWSR
jgi:pimeloyl-ACP methyl ester carboxylesterase